MVAHMSDTKTNTSLRNPTTSELPALLAELEESSLGVAAFARSRGLKPQNLYRALHRDKRKVQPAITFDAVRISGLGSERAAFRLELSSGHKLSVPVDFESSALRRLLEVLGTC